MVTASCSTIFLSSSMIFRTMTSQLQTLYDDETVRKIMERHYDLMRKFREAEFSRKLKTAVETRSKGYENEIIKEGDMVFYLNQDKKAWLGPVAVFSVQKNSIFLFANGSMKKVPRCNVQLCNYEGESGEQQLTEKDESG